MLRFPDVASSVQTLPMARSRDGIDLFPRHGTVLPHDAADAASNPVQVLIPMLFPYASCVGDYDPVNVFLQHMELRDPIAPVEEMKEVPSRDKGPMTGGEVFNHASGNTVEIGQLASACAVLGPRHCKISCLISKEWHGVVM